jgi:hypothetical protein
MKREGGTVNGWMVVNPKSEHLLEQVLLPRFSADICVAICNSKMNRK